MTVILRFSIKRDLKTIVASIGDAGSINYTDCVHIFRNMYMYKYLI